MIDTSHQEISGLAPSREAAIETATGPGWRSSPSSAERDQWSKLQSRIHQHSKKHPPLAVFGDASKKGRVYRWGVTTAQNGECTGLQNVLSRLATDRKIKKQEIDGLDLALAAEVFCDVMTVPNARVIDSAMALMWAAAMPGLIDRLETRVWWDLLGKLQHLREHALEITDHASPNRLIMAGELGLTLAWRLRNLPSCKRLMPSSYQAIKSWFKQEADCVPASVQRVADTRLVLASVVRCERLIRKTTKHRMTKPQVAIASELATWVAGLTNPGGSSALCPLHSGLLVDDVPSSGGGDLLTEATKFDHETLSPAISAALGKSQTGGRLAWEVCLPEAFLHCEDAKIAVMMPEWDIRRGRVVVDYSQDDCHLEVYAGRAKAISGSWQVMITSNNEEQSSIGPWEETCEFTDDDVHYIELEQSWSGGLVLQRQILVIRDDRCVFLADNVLPDETDSTHPDSPNVASLPERQLRYTGRIPLGDDLEAEPDSDTREFVLRNNKRRGLVIPLAASEWRIGPTQSKLVMAEDRHWVLTAQATNRLYAPLWLDLVARRLKRCRTWRRLTVADELRVVPDNEAVGFRIQSGSEHWMIYRSLHENRCRSVLGKHLIADFFAGRFDPGDGGFEELVTVQDSDE